MKIYSNDYEERLYSTGDDFLDDLLEKAFCDGYEYAQREFGNKANKAFFKALERSKAEADLKSLGFNRDPKDIINMVRVNRIRNRAKVTGASINSIDGITPRLAKKPHEKLNLNQRINTKGALKRGGKTANGFEGIQQNKEIMQGNRWEALTGGDLGSSSVHLWDRTR